MTSTIEEFQRYFTGKTLHPWSFFNKEDKIIPLKSRSVGERVWERWSTCWRVLAGVRASTFEEKRVKSGGSFHLSARRRRRTGKNQPLGHLFILSLPLLFRFGFYSAVNVCARSFRPAGMYYGPNKRSRHIVYELLASPKKQQRPIFSQKTPLSFQLHLITGAKTIIIIKKKKKRRLSRAVPWGIQSGSAGSFRAAEKVSL